MKRILVALCLSSLMVVSFGDQSALFRHVMLSIVKVIRFVKTDIQHLNMDGVFGLRVGQGQLSMAAQICNSKPNCQPLFSNSLVRLEKDIDRICNDATTSLKSYKLQYYQRFKILVSKPFKIRSRYSDFTNRDLSVEDSSHDTKETNEDSYDETLGDECYSRLFGTFLQSGRYTPKCNITAPCWHLMTSRAKGYKLTHQLIYFIALHMMKCSNETKQYGYNENKDIKTMLCAKIYTESKKLIQKGHFDDETQDLFMEQNVLCGMLGFTDFITPDRMELVMSWQNENGCYGKTQKNKREERIMKDQCLSHTTGLGIALLCTYMKYLVQFLM